jgi:hypothetical protein
MNRTAIVCTCVATLGLGAAILSAGPLNPPAGAVAPTYKTLTEVEPRTALTTANAPGDADSVFKITTPGSYYLTQDLVAPAGRAGIEITVTTGAVTLDLNGFRVHGAGAGAAVPGIDFGRSHDVTLLNGTVSNFMGTGVYGANSDNCRVEGVRILQSRESGMRLGEGALVERCEFVSNGLALGTLKDGCELGNAALVSSCVFRANAGYGLHSGEGSSISDSTFRSNTLAGVLTGHTSTLRACTALENASNGFVIGPFSSVRDCTTNGNTGYGFGGGVDITFQGCTARDNTEDGFQGGAECVFAACISANNGDHGIFINGRGVVTDCVITSNDGNGIEGGGQFSGNMVSFSGIDGIHTFGAAQISNNTCISNGQAGVGANINLDSVYARAENNTCSNADFGILSIHSNVIIRNTCFGNTTNYSVAAGASVGTIFNLSGGVDITTTNSFANFEY